MVAADSAQPRTKHSVIRMSMRFAWTAVEQFDGSGLYQASPVRSQSAVDSASMPHRCLNSVHHPRIRADADGPLLQVSDIPQTTTDHRKICSTDL